MSLNTELRDLIRSIVRSEFEEIYGIACKVSNVREDEQLGFVCDCEPINGRATIEAVRLKAEPDGGVLIIPADGSVVFIQQESSTEAYVTMFGRISQVIYFDGENGGLVKSSEVASKLNTLEERMFNHQHLSAAPGVQTAPDPATNPIIPNTTSSELENDLFLH